MVHLFLQLKSEESYPLRPTIIQEIPATHRENSFDPAYSDYYCCVCLVVMKNPTSLPCGKTEPQSLFTDLFTDRL
jgi:hypothetical protein